MKFFIIIIQKVQTSFQNCSLKILTTKENLSVLTCLSQSKGHTFKRSHWFSSLFSQQVLVYIQWLALPNPFLVPLTPLSISIPKCSDISLNYLNSKSKQKPSVFFFTLHVSMAKTFIVSSSKPTSKKACLTSLSLH